MPIKVLNCNNVYSILAKKINMHKIMSILKLTCIKRYLNMQNTHANSRNHDMIMKAISIVAVDPTTTNQLNFSA